MAYCGYKGCSFPGHQKMDGMILCRKHLRELAGTSDTTSSSSPSSSGTFHIHGTPEFVATSSFRGKSPGYEFKSGYRGTGYYRIGSSTAPKKVTVQSTPVCRTVVVSREPTIFLDPVDVLTSRITSISLSSGYATSQKVGITKKGTLCKRCMKGHKCPHHQ